MKWIQEWRQLSIGLSDYMHEWSQQHTVEFGISLSLLNGFVAPGASVHYTGVESGKVVSLL